MNGPAGVIAARRTAGPIFKVPAHGMALGQLSAPEKFGLDPMSFYVLARGAALGPVRPELIASSFVWLHPDLVARSHATGTAVLSAAEADAHWRQAMNGWATQALGDHQELPRLAELLGHVVNSADGAQSAIFVGWRAGPVPDDAAAQIVHYLYALRELRSSMHACAVLASGLSPQEAVVIRTPWLAEVFGWPAPVVTGDQVRWTAAEDATDIAMARIFAILSGAEQIELADRLDDILTRTGALWTDDASSPATIPRPVPGTVPAPP